MNHVVIAFTSSFLKKSFGKVRVEQCFFIFTNEKYIFKLL